MNSKPLQRLQIRCRGTVQGVGFRPAVHRIATSLGLAGWVVNDPQGATIEIEGSEEAVADKMLVHANAVVFDFNYSRPLTLQ